ncbi:hypothetical protein QTL97_06225 [Sporosarcina thermotolerans]|uniref:Uncharacterized protein n=1 Tax=Sporosarcina thermotolerans TaxID=633404 RepID=A0AAW9ABN6_9BACL|nr:hypothetical protein [Sporosarcina thermotolerans]MDW0116523.1 hypothetical protein [Sporosarcina thermotolerans]WHT48746.1 hypothetical protein QNH10_03050 [Sporosarcina thermotolerans]
MMCGSKCFIVTMEQNGTKEIKQVNARTPIGARKVIRGEYGAKVEILSVKEKKWNQK